MPGVKIWNSAEEVPEGASPIEYENEAELHRLIESNPHFLPLSGAPNVTVLGSEVTLGWGSLDVLAIESTGRPVLIEVKLVRNLESYREIVAQILFYAAFLRGLDVDYLERYRLGESIVEVVEKHAEVDKESFNSALQAHLDRGDFRLVLALDGVHPELERILAYLESITTSEVTIDLVTLPMFEVNGAQTILSRRVTPQLDAADEIARPTGDVTPGSYAFRESIVASGVTRQRFEHLISWAEKMAESEKIEMTSYAGASPTLVLYVKQSDLVMVSILNVRQEPRIAVYRPAFECHAPNSIEKVEEAIAPKTIGHGNYIGETTNEALDALTEAFQEVGGVLV